MAKGSNRGGKSDARRTEDGKASRARDEAVHRDPDIGGVGRREASRDSHARGRQERATNHRDLRPGRG